MSLWRVLTSAGFPPLLLLLHPQTPPLLAPLALVAVAVAVVVAAAAETSVRARRDAAAYFLLSLSCLCLSFVRSVLHTATPESFSPREGRKESVSGGSKREIEWENSRQTSGQSTPLCPPSIDATD